MEKTSITELEKRFDEDYLQRLRSLRLMDDDFMTKVFEELIEQGEKQGAKQNLIINIKALMKTMNLSVEQAMDALMVTADMRDELKKIIQAA